MTVEEFDERFSGIVVDSKQVGTREIARPGNRFGHVPICTITVRKNGELRDRLPGILSAESSPVTDDCIGVTIGEKHFGKEHEFSVLRNTRELYVIRHSGFCRYLINSEP